MRLPKFVPVLASCLSLLAGAAAGGSLPAANALQTKLVAERTAALNAAFARHNVTPAERTKLTTAFGNLPVEAQDVVLARIDPGFATKVHLAPSVAPFAPPAPPAATIAPPLILGIYPAKGQPGQGVAVVGANIQAGTCQVLLDNQTVTSSPFWGMRVFTLPKTAKVGIDHPVMVRDTQTKLASAPTSYHVIAPRGYRGTNGWQFSNFSTQEMSWDLFRDYFGALWVEYPNGTHRPSAEFWYLTTYKGIGQAGDCLGMSLRSIRTLQHQWARPFKSWWPSHLKPTVWDYSSSKEVLDSIRQDQAGQLSLQAMAITTDRWNHQTNDQAFLFIAVHLPIAALDPNHQPIMCMWVGNKKGHAVVAYDMETVVGQPQIRLYDNNKPYTEHEIDDEGSVALVTSGGTHFAYGSYDRMNAFTYAELATPVPLLPMYVWPGGVGAVGSDTTVVVCDAQSGIRQITDENGRTFYTGGAENRNQASRIPESMRFVPLSGGELPPGYPAIYVFNKSKGKTLTLDLEHGKPGTVKLFNAGQVTTLTGQTGKVHFSKLLTPEQSLKVVNPSALKLQEVNMISIDPDHSEKVFHLEGLAGIQQGMEVQLDPKGLVLNHGMAGAVSLGVHVKRYSSAGVDQGALHKLSVPASQKAVVKPNFADLKLAPAIELRKM